ncbi:hypothetical protein ACQY0O_001742 [Thecaphora frezii]
MSALPAFREPFTVDVIFRFLDKIPFSPPFLVLSPLLTFAYDRHVNHLPLTPLPPLDQLVPQLCNLLVSQYKWVGFAWLFTLAKTLNRTANRYVRNHGKWRRDPINYDQDVVVITGGSAGIGKEIVQLLSHRKRATIAVLDMAPPTYLAPPSGAPEILYFKTDVSDPEQVAAAAQQIRVKTGKKVGVLINCAGLASGGTILKANLASVSRLWRVNALANWVTCQQFVPDMVQRNHGHVVTISSSGGYFSIPSLGEYASSKAAALAFHETLSIEMRTRYGAPRVRTTLVAPTKVRTAMGNGMEDASNPFLTPTLEPVQVAQQVVAALDSGLSQHIMTPHFANLLPWLRVLPDWYRRLLSVTGGTDNTVTEKSMARSTNNGYGKNWEGDDKGLYEQRLKALRDTVAKA